VKATISLQKEAVAEGKISINSLFNDAVKGSESNDCVINELEMIRKEAALA
jgi:hypothetical protein